MNFDLGGISYHLKHTIEDSIDVEGGDQKEAYWWHKGHWPRSSACSVSVEPPYLPSPLE